MAIKWKNIRFTNWVKFTAVLFGIAGVLMMFSGLTQHQDFPYGTQAADYRNSQALSNKLNDITQDVYRLTTFKNEDNIKSGTHISQKDIDFRINQLQTCMNYEIENITTEYETLINFQTKHNNPTETQRLVTERDQKIAKEKADFDKKAAVVKDTIIKEDLDLYNSIKSRLANQPGLYYSVVINGTVTGQDPAFFSSLPYFSKLDLEPNGVVYIGFDTASFSQQVLDYNQRHLNGLNGIYLTIAGFLLALLSLVWLMFVAGRSPDGNELTFSLVDRIYLDIGLALVGVIALPCCALAVYFLLIPKKALLYPESSIVLLIVAYLTIAAYAVILAKRFKSQELIKHTFVYNAARTLYLLTKRCFTPKRT